MKYPQCLTVYYWNVFEGIDTLKTFDMDMYGTGYV